MKSRLYLIIHKITIGVLSFWCIAACRQVQPTAVRPLQFAVESAPDWTALFNRTEGWFGGDGIFIIPSLKDGKADRTKQLILFSDTMVGRIKEGKLQEGFYMVNNSIAVLQGDQPNQEAIEFPLPEDESGRATSIFPIKLPAMEENEYYWLGDGFVSPANGNTYIFAYRVANRLEWEDALFKFQVLGGSLIVLPPGSTFPFPDHYQLELPFFKGVNEGNISFGAGIYESIDSPGADGYIYIYGIRDPGKQLLAARVRPGQIEDFSEWRFFDGSGWQGDFESCATITDSVSNELSVSPTPNGQFALIFQINGLGKMVGMRLGDSPIGPFSAIKEIWNCSESLVQPEFFAYNAKGHPSISKPGELLVSYNVNSFAFWDQIRDNPNLYRPRFFTLKFQE